MKILNLFLLLFPFFLNGQANEGYHSFQNETSAWLLGNDVNIRDKASTNGKVVAKLPINTYVHILEGTGVFLELKGISAEWYKISFRKDGNWAEGYIWGGMIATNRVQSQVSEDWYYLYGLEKIEDNDGYQTCYIQVRLAYNNEEESKVVFEGIGQNGIPTQLIPMGDKKIEDVIEVLRLDFIAQACAAPSGDIYLFHSEGKLHHVKSTHSGSDVPAFFREQLIFPTERGGKDKTIIHESKGGEYTEDGGEEIERHEKLEYVWKKGKLVKK